jgi:hypothetical protein
MPQTKKPAIQPQPSEAGPARVVHSTSLSLPGPWLLSREAVRELDALVADIWRETNDAWRKTVSDAKREEVYFHQQAPERKVSLLLKGRHQVDGASFEALEKVPDVASMLPVGFQIDIGTYHSCCRIGLGREQDKLDLSVTPEGADGSAARFAQLEMWATRHGPPLSLRLWREWAFLPRSLSFLYVMVSFLVIFLSAQNAKYEQRASADRAQSAVDSALMVARGREFRRRAGALLAGGIQPGEVPAAIELLLANESGLIGPNSLTTHAEAAIVPAAPIGKWCLRSAVGLLVLLILCFPPGSVIAVGRGETSLRRRQVWVRLVTYIIPATILMNVLLPWALRWW